MGRVQRIENLTYQPETGAAGLLDLYLPEETDCRALLLYFHGGGLEGGDKRDEEAIYQEIAANGIVVASANYCLYPDARYPLFVEDAAKAAAWCREHVRGYRTYGQFFIGGTSAGAYLSMMLHFQPEFLAACGVEERETAGYIFDAGQPTVHYNVLRERGIDPGAVRIDEAAPLFYLDGERPAPAGQRFLFFVSDNDIKGRREQNELLLRTMETHGYSESQLTYCVMEGYPHVGYVHQQDEKGAYPYAQKISAFCLGRPLP
ncbi:MAG: alpha/beta hydrolase [Eubacteriales bacterium]|nr:alpha/beta hydrolase [Eubacteriales bacterium]